MMISQKNISDIVSQVEANMATHMKDALAQYSAEHGGISGSDAVKQMMNVIQTLTETVEALRAEIDDLKAGGAKKGKQGKKERKKKDPDAPKKKPSGYIMYGAHVRETLGAEGYDKVKIAAIANIWRSESNTEAWNEYAKADGEGDAPDTIDIVNAYTTFMARAALDTDGDGKISPDEIAAAKKPAPKKKAAVKKPAEPVDPIDQVGTKASPFHKVGAIREELERRGLVTTGKKGELVERLKEAMRNDETSDYESDAGEGKHCDDVDELD